MILTDREIQIYNGRRLITIDPEPDKDTAYQSSAVDLTLDPVISVFKEPGTIVPGIQQFTQINPGDPAFKAEPALKAITDNIDIEKDEKGFHLDNGHLVLGWTREYLDLKDSRLAARVEGKSSLARFGLAIHLTAPTIHAGYEGRIRLEIVNHGKFPILLRGGMRICQLILEQTFGTPEKGYSGQFAGQVPETSRG
jgi:dCTP deaminase